MPQHPTARRHISKPLTDREVALSNDTANAFLGPKRKPAWLSGNRPTQTTVPPLPCAPQARTETNPAVLPSPAPSDEPSPVFSSVLDSPNASSPVAPGPSVASQTQSAMPSSLPYTTAEYACASPVLCDPMHDGISQLPASDASQLPLGRPNIMTPSVSIPNLGTSGVPAVPTATRSFTFPLSTNPVGSPVAPPLESHGGPASETSRTVTPTGVNPAKRRRLNNNSGSLQLATSIPRISQQRQLIANLTSASADLARPRLVLLKDACVRDDMFFVLLHQLFCVHSRSPNEVYQYLSQDPGGAIVGGFRIVEQFLRANKPMDDQHLDWFTSFPAPLNTIFTQMPSYSALLGDVGNFLRLLNMHWGTMLQAMMARKFPFLMEELVAILNCRSPVLQDIIFTSSRRRLEVNDQPFGNDLDSLFKMDRQSRSHEIIEFIPNPTSQVYARILNRNAHLISSFRETIQRQRQHQHQHQYQFQQQAMASTPQHSRVTQQSPPLVQSPTVPFPVPTPSSTALAPGQVTAQFNPQSGELGVQSTYIQSGQTYSQAQIMPSFAVADSMGGHIGQQGAATSPMQSPLFGQGPFPSDAAQVTYPLPANDPHQPSSFGQPAPQRRSQTWHQPTSHQQTLQQQIYQQHLQLSSPQSFGQQPPVAQAQMIAQWAQAMRQAQTPLVQPPQAVTMDPRQQVQPGTVPNPAHGGLVYPSYSMQVVNGSAAQPMVSYIPAVSSEPQIVAEARVFPPRGFRITRSEWPYDVADAKAIQMSLHQAHLRSPKRVLRPEAAEGASNGVERYYQSVQRFAVDPTHIPPSQYIYRFDFDIDQASFALLETSVTPSGERLPQSNYFQGSLRYRLRCIRKRGPLPEPFHLPEAAWTTTETTWPSHMGLKLNNDCLTIRRQTHNGKDLPLELTTLIKPGTNSLQVSYPPAVNTIRRGGYILAVEIIETMSHSSVLDLVWNNGVINAQATRDTVKSRLAKSSSAAAASADKDDDDDDGLVIVEEGLSIDLADPFSAKIFEVPVRGAGCAHMECFDLENWLQTRPPANKPVKCVHKMKPCGCNETLEPSHPDRWKCPVCGEGDARPRSLRVDGFLLEVRRRLEAEGRLGAKAVLVMPDGSWNAVVEDDDGDEGSDGEGPAASGGGGVNGVVRRKSAVRVTTSADRGQHVEVVELLDDDD